jgi:hypothetical protein
MSPAVQKVNNEICRELEQDCPNEALIIEKTVSMASQMYRESEANSISRHPSPEKEPR